MLGICVENVSLGSNLGPVMYLLLIRSNFLNLSELQIAHLQDSSHLTRLLSGLNKNNAEAPQLSLCQSPW